MSGEKNKPEWDNKNLLSSTNGGQASVMPVRSGKESLQGSNGSLGKKKGKHVQMERGVGLTSAVALIVGTMIGSGIFVSPKGVIQRSGSVALSLIVWAGCGLLSLFGALSYAELGTMIPKSGGEHAYLNECFGAIPAYLFAWTTMFVLKPAAVSIMSLTFAEYIVDGSTGGCTQHEVTKKLLACVCLLLVTFVNSFSVNLATKMQNVFTAAKLLAIAIVVGAGIYKLCQGHTEYLATGFEGSTTSVSDIATAFYSGLWAYDGWNNLNFITEELSNPYVNLPRAIMIGIPVVTVSYVMINVAYMSVMSTADLLTSDAVAVRFAAYALGPLAASVPLFVAISSMGSTNGSFFSGTRLALVAAREGHTLEIFSYIHVRRLTPAPSSIFLCMVAICMILPGKIGSLIDFFSFTAWLFYGGTMLSLIVMRFTKKHLHRPYKVPIIIPVIVFVLSMYLVVAPIVQKPQIEYLYASLFVASGLIFYVPFVHYKCRLGFMRKFTRYAQLLLNVAPSGYTEVE